MGFFDKLFGKQEVDTAKHTTTEPVNEITDDVVAKDTREVDEATDNIVAENVPNKVDEDSVVELADDEESEVGTVEDVEDGKNNAE